MDNNLLKYQELDKKLFSAKKASVSPQYQKELQQVANSIKQWQTEVLKLEQESKNLLAEYDKLMSVEKKGLSFVEKCNKTDISKMTDDELADFDAKTKQTANQLLELENRIVEHQNKVKKIVYAYKALRKNILDARARRDEIKTKQDEFAKQKQPEIDNIRAEMSKLEKSIDQAKLAKYKLAKQDGIFPVLVPLQENRCSGCRMQLSTLAIDKLKKDGIYECEQCRRLIYFDKD